MIGKVLRLLGRNQEAAIALHDAEELHRRLGQTLPAALIRFDRALLAETEGRWHDAERLFAEALAVLEQQAAGSPTVLRARSQVALFRCRAGRAADISRAEIEDTLEVLRAMLGPGSSTVAAVVGDLEQCTQAITGG
jgi:ATP/maltotriose-dependent transcriptional regulator MalT